MGEMSHCVENSMIRFFSSLLYVRMNLMKRVFLVACDFGRDTLIVCDFVEC